jgi:hypothetical protein
LSKKLSLSKKVNVYFYDKMKKEKKISTKYKRYSRATTKTKTKTRHETKCKVQQKKNT